MKKKGFWMWGEGGIVIAGDSVAEQSIFYGKQFRIHFGRKKCSPAKNDIDK